MKHILALAGGVGGAKLADGLARVLPDGDLTVVVNIGDDFEHYGLHISPDLDTVMYTLSGLANPETGWGVVDESWQMLAMLEQYGETPWFRLGDRDIGTHLLRTHLLRSGQTLTAVTRRFFAALGVKQTVLPACDTRCATIVNTIEEGKLAFQDYFVRHRWGPTVTQIIYDGVEAASVTPEVSEAIERADAIIICPSNPVLSIDPILAVGDFRKRLAERNVPCVAVSPLIHGQAVKGPAAKIMAELNYDPSTTGLQRFYDGLIDGLVVDTGDVSQDGVCLEADILMKTRADRDRLANEVLEWTRSLV